MDSYDLFFIFVYIVCIMFDTSYIMYFVSVYFSLASGSVVE